MKSVEYRKKGKVEIIKIITAIPFRYPSSKLWQLICSFLDEGIKHQPMQYGIATANTKRIYVDIIHQPLLYVRVAARPNGMLSKHNRCPSEINSFTIRKGFFEKQAFSAL